MEQTDYRDVDEQRSQCQDQQVAGVEMRKLPLETTAYTRPEFMIYQRECAHMKLDVKFGDDIIRHNQQMHTMLFHTTRPSVGLQLRLIHG
jgi:hypothetical protein